MSKNKKDRRNQIINSVEELQTIGSGAVLLNMQGDLSFCGHLFHHLTEKDNHLFPMIIVSSSESTLEAMNTHIDAVKEQGIQDIDSVTDAFLQAITGAQTPATHEKTGEEND